MSARETLERDLVKCEDMRVNAQRAREFLGERTLDDFLEDDLVQAAVVRCVEVIGEAARKVSEETRRCAPGIPWVLVIGMRNILAHDYGVVNLDKVYEVVTIHVPDLIVHLQALIQTLEREVGWSDDIQGRS